MFSKQQIALLSQAFAATLASLSQPAAPKGRSNSMARSVAARKPQQGFRNVATAVQPASAKPKPFTPQMKALQFSNHGLTQSEVAHLCKTEIPAVPSYPVGKWYWAEPEEGPQAKADRDWLMCHGFHKSDRPGRVNPACKAWQHACGNHVSRKSPTDPRDTYGMS